MNMNTLFTILILLISYSHQAQYERDYFVDDWIAYGYRCNAKTPPTEEVKITNVGDEFVAVKTIGDDCVTTGHETFRAKLQDKYDENSRLHTTWIVGNAFKPNSGKMAGNLQIKDIDTFYDAPITFKRKIPTKDKKPKEEPKKEEPKKEEPKEEEPKKEEPKKEEPKKEEPKKEEPKKEEPKKEEPKREEPKKEKKPKCKIVTVFDDEDHHSNHHHHLRLLLHFLIKHENLKHNHSLDNLLHFLKKHLNDEDHHHLNELVEFIKNHVDHKHHHSLKELNHKLKEHHNNNHHLNQILHKLEGLLKKRVHQKKHKKHCRLPKKLLRRLSHLLE